MSEPVSTATVAPWDRQRPDRQRQDRRRRVAVVGSRTYVGPVAEGLTAVPRSAPVRAVRRHLFGVGVVTEDSRRSEAHALVIATPADQALRHRGRAGCLPQRISPDVPPCRMV